jgi:transaldolase
LRNRLGIAIARRTYRAYRELFDSARWRSLESRGAVVQRLLWASTGTKDPAACDTLYIEALVAPETINTMPEKTLLAFADHGRIETPMPVDGGDASSVLSEFARAGVDVLALASRLQRDGASAFVESWKSLLRRIAGKRAALPASRVRSA